MKTSLYLQIFTTLMLIGILLLSLLTNRASNKAIRNLNDRVTRLERATGIHGTDQQVKRQLEHWKGQQR